MQSGCRCKSVYLQGTYNILTYHMYVWVYRSPRDFFTNSLKYFYLKYISIQFYSQHIQYEEIRPLHIGFLPNIFLFTKKSKIVSIILSLLKLEHSSSPISTTTACATTRTADHQHQPETTTTGGETSQASYQETL